MTALGPSLAVVTLPLASALPSIAPAPIFAAVTAPLASAAAPTAPAPRSAACTAPARSLAELTALFLILAVVTAPFLSCPVPILVAAYPAPDVATSSATVAMIVAGWSSLSL